MPDVTTIRTDIRLIVSDVALVPCDVTPVGAHVRLRRVGGRLGHSRSRSGLTALCAHILTQVASIRMHILPVGTDVCAVLLKVLTVPADVSLVAGDVALLVLARALLGVLLPQSPFIVTQVRAIPLDVLTVGPDVRVVATDVAAVIGHVVTITRTASGLAIRLLVIAIPVSSERRGVYLRASLRNAGVPARVGRLLARLLIVGHRHELIVCIRG
jgi:hypothetical protein